MGDKSTNSGVKNIRAMFESRNEDTSPPSRGRSPAAGSEGVRSNSSRPVSKIRASFVAVEGSGGALGLRKLSNTMENEGDGEGSKRPNITSEPRDKYALNGSATIGDASRNNTNGKQGDATAGADPNSTSRKENQETFANGSAKSRGNGASAKGESKASDSTRGGIEGGLGAVLKGSPFEPVAGEKPQERTTAPKQAPKGKSSDSAAKPSTSKSTEKAPGGSTFTSKSASNQKSQASRPAAIATSAGTTSSKPKAESGPSSSSKSSKTVKTPATPKAATSKDAKPAGQAKSMGKVSATQQATTAKEVSKATSGESTKAPVHKTSRQSLATHKDADKTHKSSLSNVTATSSRKPASTSTKPPAGSPAAATKKPVQTSPGGFVKPPPKSPTRPVRLPASATAQTAASSAKLGRKSQSPSRAGPAMSDQRVAASKSQGVAPRGQSKTIRPKASRPSLGVAPQSQDRSPSRASMTSRAGDGDFLSRMMRPTASSSKKTQDKPDIKNIPSKVASMVRSHRKSEATDKRGKHGDEKVTVAEQAGSSAAPPPAETSKIPESAALPEAEQPHLQPEPKEAVAEAHTESKSGAEPDVAIPSIEEEEDKEEEGFVLLEPQESSEAPKEIKPEPEEVQEVPEEVEEEEGEEEEEEEKEEPKATEPELHVASEAPADTPETKEQPVEQSEAAAEPKTKTTPATTTTTAAAAEEAEEEAEEEAPIKQVPEKEPAPKAAPQAADDLKELAASLKEDTTTQEEHHANGSAEKEEEEEAANGTAHTVPVSSDLLTVD